MPAGTDRISVLRGLRATPAECVELLSYNENHFEPTGLERIGSLPLADEPFRGGLGALRARGGVGRCLDRPAERTGAASFPCPGGYESGARL